MPQHELYLQRTTKERLGAARNPVEATLERQLLRVIEDGRPHRWQQLPWSSADIRIRRLYAALVSFVDDYQGPYPAECFPCSETQSLTDAFRAANALTLLDQFRLALAVADGHLFATSVLLHSATRQLARGRDTRALQGLPSSLDTRLEAGRAIVPFPPAVAGEGDALGDTYHFWANCTAGMCYTLSRRQSLVVRHLLHGMFFMGPDLMLWVRERTFGSVLFAGNHKAVDRMGLRLGIRIGEAALAQGLHR